MSTQQQVGIIEALAEELPGLLRGRHSVEVRGTPGGAAGLVVTWDDGGVVALTLVGESLAATSDLSGHDAPRAFSLDDPATPEEVRSYMIRQDRIRLMRPAMGMWKDRDDLLEIDDLRPDRYHGPDLAS